jgi:hypothetical protein
MAKQKESNLYFIGHDLSKEAINPKNWKKTYSTNRYGVDVSYFKRELKHLISTLENRKPDELARYLKAYAKVAEETESTIK